MIVEIQYNTKILEESPSDYDLTKITDKNEIKFLKWMSILQGTATTLSYEISCFNYFSKLYILNDTFKMYYNVFFCHLLEGLTASISINFAKLICKENEMCIQNLRDEAYNMQYLFKFKDYNTMCSEIRKPLSKIRKEYNKYYKDVRNMIFAHSDLIMLDEHKIAQIMNQSLIVETDNLLNEIQTILNVIWNSYSKHNLCYEFVHGDDYKDIAKTLCEKYNNTQFINI